MKILHKIFLIGLFFLVLSCQKPIDFEAEEKKIQAQIDLVSEAHFNKDAKLFFQPNAEKWYDVRGGLVKQLNKSDAIPATQSYLDNMEFKELIKKDTPIIEISDDGTLATYIGSVFVKGVLSGSPVFWVVSWQSVLRKIGGEWKIISAANTEANTGDSAVVLLKQVQEKLGELNAVSSIYANAECSGPNGAFKTLVLSRKTDGKMEQISSNGNHNILKHGEDVSWNYNVKTQSLTDSIDQSTKQFIHGHELHWLSFYPQDRYSNPVLKEIKEFDNEMAFNVEFKDILNRPVNFYYSFETYIPLGFDIRVNEKGDVVTIQFEDWEKIDDVLVFKKAVFKQGDLSFIYNFTDIKLNELKNQDFENRKNLILQ